MAYKDILVHLDDDAESEARLKLALRLAESHEAHVTALHVMPSLEIGSAYVAEAGPQLIEMHNREVQANAKKSETIFSNVSKQENVLTEWRCEEGDAAKVIIQQGRYADLVIVGQTMPEEDFPPFRQLPESVVLATGCPVLVVPYIAVSPDFGSRIMVAWDGSREAARAVNDAMPFLRRAEHVLVLEIDPQSEGRIPGADICTHLARNNVTAEATQTPSAGLDIDDVLLSRAADVSINLLVMGAYGHSRFQELVLGGATRGILGQMTFPVLMSH